MWRIIEQAISESIGNTFEIQDKKSVTGGDINIAFQVFDNRLSFFVKLNDKDCLENFEQECYALQQIEQLSPLSVPQPIAVGITLDKSYLVLNFQHFSNHDHWQKLGADLATMHLSCTHGEYGWQNDNFIGTTLQPNPWQKNWAMFFAEQRIGWQLQLLAEKSIYLGDIDHISEHIHQLLLHHHPRPSLLHGDLWQGNIGFTETECFVFDPASYYGDRECDIAMTELFGQFPEQFYHGYKSQFPLAKGYEERKHIYNFYHILNHANLFGGVYIDQSKAMLQRLLSTMA